MILWFSIIIVLCTIAIVYTLNRGLDDLVNCHMWSAAIKFYGHIPSKREFKEYVEGEKK